MTARAGGAGGAVGRGLGRLGWRARDYAYVLARQAEGPLRRRPEELVPSGPATRAPVVLVPGVYEAWTFLRPLGMVLRDAGHPVRVLPALGRNRGPIPDAARELGRFVAAEDLAGVVVVAHSKGGLIGKLAMLREDPAGRIAGMVAIATPFAGSPYARWVPLRAVRAFVPTDATLVALAAERAVNARIASVYSRFDPHIPGCCALDGAAANVVLGTPGHFRVLADPRLPSVVLDAVGRLGARPPAVAGSALAGDARRVHTASATAPAPPRRRVARGVPARGRGADGRTGVGVGPAGAVGGLLGGLSAVVGRARGAKPLHPVGVVLQGRLLRTGAGPDEASGVAWLDERGSDDVVVRLSRGGGLPVWAPDVHGIALRHVHRGRTVDVLLSTTGSIPGARHVLAPQRTLGGGVFTSLLPYRGPHGPVLLAARPVPKRALPFDPVAVATALAAEPLRLRLAWSAGLVGAWRPFGWLVVGGPAQPTPDPGLRFDPLQAPPGLDTYRWVGALRDRAYARARTAVPEPRDPAAPGLEDLP